MTDTTQAAAEFRTNAAAHRALLAAKVEEHKVLRSGLNHGLVQPLRVRFHKAWMANAADYAATLERQVELDTRAEADGGFYDDDGTWVSLA